MERQPPVKVFTYYQEEEEEKEKEEEEGWRGVKHLEKSEQQE